MESIGLYDEPGLQDPATVVRRLLEKAYRLDITLACAECFSGGGIASKLAAADSRRRQFAGGLILNCDQAIGEAVGMDRSYARRAAGADLALAMARAAQRSMGAGLALGVVAPRGAMRFGAISLAAADDCGKAWFDDISSRDQPEREIIARALAFFMDCLTRSDSGHF